MGEIQKRQPQTIGGKIEQKLTIDLRGLRESKSIIRPPPQTILTVGPPQRPIVVNLWYPLEEFATRFEYEIHELQRIKYFELRLEHHPKRDSRGNFGGMFTIETYTFYFVPTN